MLRFGIISDKTAVRLRKHVINPLDPKESDSPLAFWEVNNSPNMVISTHRLVTYPSILIVIILCSR